MRIAFASVAAAAALALASPARAQFVPQAGGASTGVHVFGIVEGASMLAKESFDAVLADSVGSTPVFAGAGVEATGLWKGVFARVTVTHTLTKGSRVFVDSGGKAFPLNIPLTIKMTPIEIGGGWRFGDGAVRPYVGAAVLMQRYTETSEHATADENVESTDSGQTIFGGVQLGFGLARVGLEALYRHVPDVIGVAGVSEAYGETNLGGRVFRVTFGVEF
jgi:hypothetical protein